MAERSVTEPAPGKINPFLRVLGRRRDGFHDIETLVLPVTLADGVRASEGRGLSVRIAGPHARGVPPGEENLVLRSASALARATGEERGCAITLVKNVPVAAGLGGGSADAAATIRALDRLWGLDLDRDRLIDVAAEVGSDVPALVPGGPVVARGRGELVEEVEVAKTWWVLVTLPFGVSATDAYGWWDEDGGPTGPPVDPFIAPFRLGDVEGAGPSLFNDLQGPVAARHREIEEARRRLLDAGALGAIMCGSGPTVAGLARDPGHADSIAASTHGIVASSIHPPG